MPIGRTRFALKLPRIQPRTDQDHAANMRALEAWGNDLPEGDAPLAVPVDQTVPGDGTPTEVASFEVSAGEYVMIQYWLSFAAETGGSSLSASSVEFAPAPDWTATGGLVLPSAYTPVILGRWDSQKRVAVTVEATVDVGDAVVSGAVAVTPCRSGEIRKP